MAINEKASRDATSKGPVLVYSVNQDGWSASSPSGIKRMRAVVSPPVQMNADLSTTARALFVSLALSTTCEDQNWIRNQLDPIFNKR